jgi:hypothetical protein
VGARLRPALYSSNCSGLVFPLVTLSRPILHCVCLGVKLYLTGIIRSTSSFFALGSEIKKLPYMFLTGVASCLTVRSTQMYNVSLVLIYMFVLQLVEQDEEGHCNAECKTIERACQEVVSSIYFELY